MHKQEVSKVMSELGKLSHKKRPRSKEFYKAMQAKGVAARNKRKLSTGRY